VTIRTRRRLILCVVVAALTLPAELILMKAVTLDAQEASSRWARSLSQTELAAAADDIQRYPFEYRKTIMGRLSKQKRAEVWSNHIAQYRDARPELSTDQVDALNAAIETVRATFLNPGNNAREATRVVAERVQELFAGMWRSICCIALHKKHHDHGERGAVAPEVVRRGACPVWVSADEGGPCWCRADFGVRPDCTDVVRRSVTCVVDNVWPKCGWLWDEDCDGVCKIRPDHHVN
jgi:hypothetical protein